MKLPPPTVRLFLPIGGRMSQERERKKCHSAIESVGLKAERIGKEEEG